MTHQIPTVTSSQPDTPANPSSLAGNRKGEEDDRHIWPDIRRVVALKDPLGRSRKKRLWPH